MACEDRPITGLLPEQQAAAAHRQGHARLLAGPGTGKTRTLVALIAGLIQDGTACADEILCLTFTRAAAAGLRAKVAHAIAPRLARVPWNLRRGSSSPRRDVSRFGDCQVEQEDPDGILARHVQP